MAIALPNFAALTPELFVHFNPEALQGQLIRYTLREGLDGPSLFKARQAVQQFLIDNPNILCLSKPKPPESFLNVVKKDSFIVISKETLCITQSPEADASVPPEDRDFYFTGARIEHVASCVKGHCFEERFITEWVANKGDVCPNRLKGEHAVDLEHPDPHLRERRAQLVEQGQTIRELQGRLDNLLKFIQTNPKLADEVPDTLEGIADLDQTERARLLVCTALNSSLEELSALLNTVPNAYVDSMMEVSNVSADERALLIRKLKVILSPPAHQIVDGVSLFPNPAEQILIALKLLIPRRGVTNGWEASRVFSSLGQFAFALSSAGNMAVEAGGIYGFMGLLSAAAGLKNCYDYVNAQLPTDIPPSKNMTQLAAAGTYKPLIGRESEIEQILNCWRASTPENPILPILVGPAGAGKSSIFQEVARRIAFHASELALPDNLNGCYAYFCTASDLMPMDPMSGRAPFAGYMESMEQIRDRAIMMVDEVHTFFTEKNKAGFGERMKPRMTSVTESIPYALYATTDKEYEDFIGSDPALSRRFHVIKVNKLEKEHAVMALRFEAMHAYPGMLIDPSLFSYIYEKGNELATKDERHTQPQVSKKLLAMAANDVEKANKETPSQRKINEFQAELMKLRAKLQPGAAVEADEHLALERIEQVNAEIEQAKSCLAIEQTLLKQYDQVKKKILVVLGALNDFAKKDELTADEVKQFSILAYELLPTLINHKAEMESSLNIRVLSKVHVDEKMKEF